MPFWNSLEDDDSTPVTEAKDKLTIWQWLTSRLDVEIFYDYATKEYGIRQVYRSRFKRKDGWREYVGESKAFCIPGTSLKRIIAEASGFIRKRI
jgi:hypothetical protein